MAATSDPAAAPASAVWVYWSSQVSGAGVRWSQATRLTLAVAIRVVRVSRRLRLLMVSRGHAGGVEQAHSRGEAQEIEGRRDLAAFDAGAEVAEGQPADQQEDHDLDHPGQRRPGGELDQAVRLGQRRRQWDD